MSSRSIEQVLKTLRNYDMLRPGDRVLVAVSGGPDSVFLLHAMDSLKKKLKIKKIAVCNLDHGLRGADSTGDAAYVAELARGKTGRVYGHLMAMLTLMKGLPLAYNRDMQEDKEGLFDTVDTLVGTLDVFTGMVRTLKFKVERAASAAQEGYILATDLAD